MSELLPREKVTKKNSFPHLGSVATLLRNSVDTIAKYFREISDDFLMDTKH